MVEARESDRDLSDFTENSEPVEPGLDFYNSDSSLDEAEEKLRSVDAKFISIWPYDLSQTREKSLLTMSMLPVTLLMLTVSPRDNCSRICIYSSGKSLLYVTFRHKRSFK